MSTNQTPRKTLLPRRRDESFEEHQKQMLEHGRWVSEHYCGNMMVREDDGTERPLTNIEMMSLITYLEHVKKNEDREGEKTEAT